MSKVEEKILEAARQCFSIHGGVATQVQQIVETAGIARSTFYRHFRDVDDVLLTLVIQLWVQHLEHLLTHLAAQPDTAQRWRQLLVNMVELSSQSGQGNALFSGSSFLHVVQLFYRDTQRAQQRLIEVLVPSIKKAQATLQVRTDIGAEQIAEWLLRQAWALSSIPPKDGWQPSELGVYIDTFVLPGLLPGPALNNHANEASEQLRHEVQRLSAVIEKLDARIP